MQQKIVGKMNSETLVRNIAEKIASTYRGMKIRSTTAVNDSLNRRKKPGNRQSITVPAVFSTVSAAGPAEGSCTLASLAKKAAMKAA